MSNFLLAEPSLSDSTLDAYYATQELADAPASNLLLRQPKEVWRTSDVGSTHELRFDLGTPSGYTYNFMALLFTNASDTAQITWEGSSSSTFSGTDWSTGALSLINPGQDDRDRSHNFYLTGTSLSTRYVRILVTDSSNADGYFQAGRIYIANAYQPPVNIQYDMAFGFEDPAPTVITGLGERIVRATEPVPRLNFTLQAWGDTAQAEFYTNVHELMRKVGGSKDVVAIINPDHATLNGAMLYYGTLQNRTMVNIPSFQFYQASFELTGLI